MSVLEGGSCLTEEGDRAAGRLYRTNKVNSTVKTTRGKVRSGAQICLHPSLLIIAKPNLEY